MSEPTLPLILDKNVLQGTSPADYRALAARYRLLMPDVLFFELLKADPITRARCFRALPAGENPIELAHHIGEHLRHELATGQPLGRPSDHVLPWRYRFNPLLQVPDALPAEVEQLVEEQRAEHIARVPGYVQRIRDMHQRLAEVSHEQRISRPTAAEAIRAGLLDLPTVLAAIDEVRDPDGRVFLPPVATLEADSAVVVHFQVTHALALQRALDHGVEFDSPANVARLTPALARELFDADYLMLGVLEGGMATREKRLRRIFRWLRPQGVLFPAPTGD